MALAEKGEVSVLPLGKEASSGPAHQAAWLPQVHVRSFIHIHCMCRPPSASFRPHHLWGLAVRGKRRP